MKSKKGFEGIFLAIIVSIFLSLLIVPITSANEKTNEKFDQIYSDLNWSEYHASHKIYFKVEKRPSGSEWGYDSTGRARNLSVYQENADQAWNQLTREEKIKAISHRIKDSRKKIEEINKYLPQVFEDLPYTGIGISTAPDFYSMIEIINGRSNVILFEVTSIFRDSPGEKKLKLGDKIYAVNGSKTDNYQINAKLPTEILDESEKHHKELVKLLHASKEQVILTIGRVADENKPEEEKILEVTVSIQSGIGSKIVEEKKALLQAWLEKSPVLLKNLDNIEISDQTSDTELRKLFRKALQVKIEENWIIKELEKIKEKNTLRR